jgi:hypothetical protein
MTIDRVRRSSALGALLLLAGCDGLLQPISAEDRTRVPEGEGEVVRIFAPVDVIPRDDLATITVERVLHEDDSEEFTENRVRCLTLAITGAGVFIQDDPDGEEPPTEAEANIDRGARLDFLITSSEPGTGFIRARLLSSACSGAADAAVLTETSRMIRFAVTSVDGTSVDEEVDAGEEL